MNESKTEPRVIINLPILIYHSLGNL